MKFATTFIAAMAAASSAFAHTSAAPHIHQGSQTNWTPAIATFTLLGLAAIIATRRIKAASKAKTKR